MAGTKKTAPKKPTAKKQPGYFEKAEKECGKLMKQYGVKSPEELAKKLYKA